MTLCWSQNQNNRPTFKMCVQEIETLLENEDEMSEISGGYISNGCQYLHSASQGPRFSSANSSNSASSAISHYHSATTAPLSSASRRTIRTNSSGLGSATPNYLRIIHDTDNESLNSRTHLGYEMPRSNQSSMCGCDNHPNSGLGYQNLHTNHVISCDNPTFSALH